MGRWDNVTPMQRLMSRVERTDGCWLWTGAKTGHGYGVIYYKGRQIGAHVLSYRLLMGDIPEGYDLDHLCRTPACVNPAHLEPVTHAENCRRGERGMRTHCPKGHEYDEANTRRVRNHAGGLSRSCRKCHADRERARRARRSGASDVAENLPVEVEDA